MTGGAVVVLGRTGRNFAAGMSGGTAFVRHLDDSLVNPELVDCLPVAAEDTPLLRALLVRHHAETASPVAGRLLDNWPHSVSEFTAVVPRDYQRVVRVISAARAAGRDIDETVMAELAGPAIPQPADALPGGAQSTGAQMEAIRA
jgi:glutamate synthase (NADPH/NADH) large chain